MAETDAEKSEAPTPRRLQEARDDGNIPKSTDLTAALSLIAAVFLLYIFGGRLLGGMKVILAAMLSNTHTPNPSRALDVVNLPVFTGTVLLQGLVPLTLGVALVALVVRCQRRVTRGGWRTPTSNRCNARSSTFDQATWNSAVNTVRR